MTGHESAMDLSDAGVERVLAALAEAGIEVYYHETDGDHYIDIHLRPVDTDNDMIALSWRHDRLGWRVSECDSTGAEQDRWLIGHVDLRHVVSETTSILAGIEQISAAPQGGAS